LSIAINFFSWISDLQSYLIVYIRYFILILNGYVLRLT